MSRAKLVMSKKEFRPRPIDVNQPIPIINDEKILEEIENENYFIANPQIKVKTKSPKNKQNSVATPLYREITEKSTIRFARPHNYIVYNEEDHEENVDVDELEYELDHSDEVFLAALNGRIKTRFSESRQLRTRGPNHAATPTNKNRREKVSVTIGVTDDMLEQLIDGLEKEAFFGHGLRQMRDNTMDGMLCCVCNDHEGDDGDALVLCDGCNMAAHQHCYGISELPVATWLCARCVSRESNSACVLCGSRYGGMKPTTDGKWVHVLCALWFPEVSFKDSFLQDPVSGIEKIHSDRWNKKCSVCNDTRGVCITCDETGCRTQFHVGCARAQGLYVEARPDDDNENNVVLTAYCSNHSLHHLEHYPVFPRDPEHTLGNETAQVAKSLGLAEEDFDIIYSYWRVKRRSHPPPLLKRLRNLEPGTSAYLSVSQRPLCLRRPEDERVRFVRLRQDFERARMLVDLVRKRELAKRQLLDTLQELIFFHTGGRGEEDEGEEEDGEVEEKKETHTTPKRVRR